MTQKPFPTSETQATELFELIHSDLKVYPVELYRKYRYSIVFLNNFTSHTWTINLQTKDAALPATCHSLAMVEIQYKLSVWAWMSDAGGKYTSMTFTTMMEEKGITVLQSHWGWGGLEPVITCWEHWELWLNEPSDFMVITYRTHLKCTHTIYSIWDWWEHFCGVWIVTSTCALYVTIHNSWQSFEICPMIFSKCSYYMLSGNILSHGSFWGTFEIYSRCCSIFDM